jgi:hypothetical protein
MKIVGAFEAKNKLGQLLDLVEQGEVITITATASKWRGSCLPGPRATAPKPTPR